MENQVIRERLTALRTQMKSAGIDYYMIPSGDFHNSEYAAEYFHTRAWFSGFTGSSGTLVLSQNWAGLWTDGRYFIQAERQLEGTGIDLFRMREKDVPTIKAYLAEHMSERQVLGFDGRVVSTQFGEELKEALSRKEIKLRYDQDLAGKVWTDRPALPCHPIYVLDDALCGKSFAEKLSDIRKVMAESKARAHLLCKLDDIAWLTNLRGNDVECNPVFLSYLFITEKNCYLFVQFDELTDEVRHYAQESGITLVEYSRILSWIDEFSFDGATLVDKNNINYAVYRTLKASAQENSAGVREDRNPTELMKAVKNETELKNIREVYLKDSAALTRFICWMKTNAGKEDMDEYGVQKRLDGMRAALPGFIELSFTTISAYGPNAAMMHYSASPETSAPIRAEGFYLVDSGGTYYGGTTDVTRTIAMGPLTQEQKKDYTLTAIAMLHLADTVFIKGCTGRNVDIMAREPMWRNHMDYKCGTGHGIGYMLNVHEGPHNISYHKAETAAQAARETALMPGMIVSDEPGVYKAGQYGIRIENILEVMEDIETADGIFYKFGHLTYVPLDPDAMDVTWMTPSDIEAYNAYQSEVCKRLTPLMQNDEERAWLASQTRAL